MIKIDLKLYSKLVSTSSRRDGARDLARELDAEDLIIFDWDDEIARFLPSMGFPQTIRGGKSWSEFLSRCAESGEAKGELPFPPANETTNVIGKKFSSGSIWVFSVKELTAIKTTADLELLASNFDIVLKSERRAKKYEGQNQTLSELTSDLRTYAEALNFAKADLHRALQEASKAKVIAENANTTKSAFLANMSHEIRTPLGAILGFSGLLKEPGLSLEDRNQYIDTISRNGQALTRIIDDILDLAKVEAGKIEIEDISFSLFALVTEVVDVFRDKAKQKGIYLLLNVNECVPNHICTDPTRLRQILINIVGNAIKFTTEGGVRINVSSLYDPEGPLRVKIEVKDTGPGLTEEQKARLFQPFMQADNSTTRRFGGTGLGLALSKRLSEALGGSITIDDCAPPKGCTFSVEFVATVPKELDREIEPQIVRVVPDRKSLPLKNIRVLLVDDSIDNQFLIERILTKNGAIVEMADNGVNAISAVSEKTFDVILMDIQMPIMDGYGAMSALVEKGYNVPVIALTAHAMLEERAKTKAAGFADHLTKPLNVPDLIEAIEKHGQHSRRKM